jgi:hypothetical protein
VEIVGPFKIESKPYNLTIEKTAKPLQLGMKSKLRGLFKGRLVGWWKFDEGGGTTANDSTGKNNGTIYGANWTTGRIGSALKLDGDDYVDIGSIWGLGVEQTKMLWVYLNTYPLNHDVYLLDEGGSESNNNWIELWDSDGSGNPKIRAGFDAGNYFDSNGGIKKGAWNHIAVISTSSGQVDIYINGLLDSSVSDFDAYTQPQGIIIGANAGSKTDGFNGMIDDVRIYNYALSADDIAVVYAGKEIEESRNWIPVLVILILLAVLAALASRRKKLQEN